MRFLGGHESNTGSTRYLLYFVKSSIVKRDFSARLRARLSDIEKFPQALYNKAGYVLINGDQLPDWFVKHVSLLLTVAHHIIIWIIQSTWHRPPQANTSNFQGLSYCPIGKRVEQ
jgi:hypothetical protein